MVKTGTADKRLIKRELSKNINLSQPIYSTG
jgi:hypothetical protein